MRPPKSAYYKHKWEGRVYDGPWEGKQVSQDRWYFRVAITPPLSVMDFNPNDLVGTTMIKTGIYFWSDALRAWVYDWSTHG
jgi:hypothetical protein